MEGARSSVVPFARLILSLCYVRGKRGSQGSTNTIELTCMEKELRAMEPKSRWGQGSEVQYCGLFLCSSVSCCMSILELTVGKCIFAKLFKVASLL